MVCRDCGTKNLSSELYCRKCGADLQRQGQKQEQAKGARAGEARKGLVANLLAVVAR